MIVVSGMPRSGSSLMMQTLKHLGVPLVGVGDYDFQGNSYLHSQDISIEDQDKVSKHNPQGYYDIPFEDHSKYFFESYEGEAMKLLGPVAVMIIPKENVEKVILCDRRGRDAQALSFMKLAMLDVEIIDKEVEAGHIDPHSLRVKSIRSYRNLELQQFKNIVNFGSASIARWWRDTDIKVLKIFYEDMIDTPELTVKTIRKFLGISGSIEEAVNNIRI
jgi:hypothetical protein